MTTDHGGTGTRYAHEGCRCTKCRAANTARYQRRRAERYATPKDPNDPRHGRPSFYSNWGCRCTDCRVAYAAHNRKQNLARKARAATKRNRPNAEAN